MYISILENDMGTVINECLATFTDTNGSYDSVGIGSENCSNPKDGGMMSIGIETDSYNAQVLNDSNL